MEKMFDSRLNTAKALEQTMKIHSLTLNKSLMCLAQILLE